MEKITAIQVLDVPVHPYSMDAAVQYLDDKIQEQKHSFVVTANAEIIMMCQDDAEYKNILTNVADLVLFGAQAIFLHRIFAGISVSADQLIHPAIRAWRHYVMLDEYCLTVFRANDSSCLVTVLEIFYFFARGFPDICRSVNRLCIHSHQCLHPVSPMNIE